jgi:hypothetical protein
MHEPGRRSLSSWLFVVISVGWYGIAAVLILTACLLLAGWDVAPQIDFDGPNVEAGPHVAMSIPVSLTVDAATHRVAAPPLGIDNAQLAELRGSLKFPVRRGGLFAVTFVVVIGSLALVWWVLGQLRGLFRSLRDGRPFVPANATRVRRIGWALIAAELARSAVLYWEHSYAAAHFAAAGLTFSARPHLNAFAIVNGLIVLAIGEVFREGTRLDEDRSLTI